MKRILDLICNHEWLIEPTALQNILTIAKRQNESIEAIEAKLGKRLENTRQVVMRGRTAVIPVHGPIFRYANMFTEVSGATSLQMLAIDFDRAVNNPDVDSIVLDIDSPGGQSSGVAEFADMVNASPKKVTAYVGDLAASAAYWIAAACDEIVVGKTASLGSIGVVATVPKNDEDGTVEIVSAQSPLKRVDPETEEGRGQIQTHVNELAKIFIDSVAAYRGVDEETVLSKFGKGGLLVGAKSVEAGMADRVSSFETLITGNARIKKEGITMSEDKVIEAAAPQLTIESLRSDYSELYQAVIDLGKTQERERIKSIEALAMPGHEKLIEELKFNGTTTAADAAVVILGAEKKNREKYAVMLREESPDPVLTVESSDEVVLDDMPLEDRCAVEWNRDKTLQSEFFDFDSFVAFRRAESRGQVRILGKK